MTALRVGTGKINDIRHIPLLLKLNVGFKMPASTNQALEAATNFLNAGYSGSDVRRTTSLIKISIFVLLLIRLAAAPISARKPDSRGPGTNGRFVVRMCKWPAQRLQRAPITSVTVPRKPGLTSGVATAVPCADAMRHDAYPFSLNLCLLTSSPVFGDLAARRCIDSPRC